MRGTYKVIGSYQNGGRPGTINYCEGKLGEFTTYEEAEAFAKIQRGTWDNIFIEKSTTEEEYEKNYEERIEIK